MRNNSPARTATRILLGLGILFLVVGGGLFFGLQYAHRDLRTEGIATEAHIIRIERDGWGDDGRSVWVIYTDLQGTVREGELHYYSSGMRVGDVQLIRFDPENPERFLSEGHDRIGSILGGVFGGVGLILILIGAGVANGRRKRNAKRMQLQLNGEEVQATITRLYPDTSYAINGRHPYRCECEYTAPNGTVYRFRSESFWNPGALQPGGKIRVWMDRMDETQYFVDVEQGAAQGSESQYA